MYRHIIVEEQRYKIPNAIVVAVFLLISEGNMNAAAIRLLSITMDTGLHEAKRIINYIMEHFELLDGEVRLTAKAKQITR
mgnify:CR=1 FL=1